MLYALCTLCAHHVTVLPPRTHTSLPHLCPIPLFVHRIENFASPPVTFLGPTCHYRILSPALRREIFLFQYRSILCELDYFRDTPDSFLAQLSEMFVTSVYGPQERIVTQGQLDQRMFIIEKGHVQYHRADPCEMSDVKYVQAVLHVFDGLMGKHASNTRTQSAEL